MLFLDTNVLLDGVDNFSSTRFVISSETLRELEDIKSSRNKTEDVRSAARRAISWLSSHYDSYDVVITNDDVYNEISACSLGYDSDAVICAAAKYYQWVNNTDITFLTHDLSCRNIAKKVFGLDVEWFENNEKIYKGYKKIVGNTEYINDYMSNINYDDWYTNEYIIINNTDDGSIKEMRFDGTMFVPLKLPVSKYIKGKDSLQRCALDILNNPSITIAGIIGGYGSGKSFITSKMALFAVQEKGWQSQVVVLRENLGEGQPVGYLPGEKIAKIYDLLLPFADQLDGGEFELESLMQRGILEANTPYFIKGRTYNNSVIIVDEAEDLNEKQVRLIGTRIGQNSRIFYNGDYKQSIINSTKNNALVKMCAELKGNPRFACIYLEEDVRSETSRLFANLFDK